MDSILKKFAVKEFGFFPSENKGINQKKKNCKDLSSMFA